MSKTCAYVLHVKRYGGYIRHVGGDWGPRHMTTDNILEAVRLPSREAARSYAMECNWSEERDWFEVVPVDVTIEVREARDGR